jgi:hypothetical protein
VHFAELFDAARAGELDRARELVAELVRQDERWRAYLRVLADLEYLPHGNELL